MVTPLAPSHDFLFRSRSCHPILIKPFPFFGDVVMSARRLLFLTIGSLVLSVLASPIPNLSAQDAPAEKSSAKIAELERRIQELEEIIHTIQESRPAPVLTLPISV